MPMQEPLGSHREQHQPSTSIGTARYDNPMPAKCRPISGQVERGQNSVEGRVRWPREGHGAKIRQILTPVPRPHCLDPGCCREFGLALAKLQVLIEEPHLPGWGLPQRKEKQSPCPLSCLLWCELGLLLPDIKMNVL